MNIADGYLRSEFNNDVSMNSSLVTPYFTNSLNDSQIYINVHLSSTELWVRVSLIYELQNNIGYAIIPQIISLKLSK